MRTLAGTEHTVDGSIEMLGIVSTRGGKGRQ